MISVKQFFLSLVLLGTIVVNPAANAQVKPTVTVRDASTIGGTSSANYWINKKTEYYDEYGNLIGQQREDAPIKDANGNLTGMLKMSRVTKFANNEVAKNVHTNDCTVNLKSSSVPGLSNVLNFSKDQTTLVPLTPFNYKSLNYISSENETHQPTDKESTQYNFEFYPDTAAPKRKLQGSFVMNKTTGKVTWFKITQYNVDKVNGDYIETVDQCNTKIKSPTDDAKGTTDPSDKSNIAK